MLQKNILIGLVTLIVSISLSAKEVRERRVASTDAELNFFATTGLEPGLYSLKRDSHEDCLSGSLYTVSLDKDFTLMLGEKLLLTGLGRGAFSDIDRECKTDVKTSFQKGIAKMVNTETCSKVVRIYQTTLVVDKGGFSYTNTVSEKGKVIKHLNCELELNKVE